MNAILRAREVYARCGSSRPFEEDLRWHLQYGVVISRPDAFVMARPVRHDAPASKLADISHTFRNPDCWLVWSAAGELPTLLQLMPEQLPLIAFHRQSERRSRPGRLRIYRTERLFSLARHSGIQDRAS